jgi:hypothetical protein
MFNTSFLKSLVKLNLFYFFAIILLKLIAPDSSLDIMIYFSNALITYIFINSALIITSNMSLYKNNLNWMRNLPVTRWILIKSHILYFFLQSLESTIIATFSFTFILLVLRPDINLIIEFIKKINLDFIISQISVHIFSSGYALAIFIASCSFMLFAFLSINEGNPFKILTIFSKKQRMYWALLSGTYYLTLMLLIITKNLPPIIVLSVFSGTLIFATYLAHISSFKLPLPTPKKLFYTQFGTMFSLFILFYSYSSYRLSDDDNSVSGIITELSFKGPLASKITRQQYLKLISDENITSNHIKLVTHLFKRDQKKLYINGRDIDYIKMIKNGKYSYKALVGLLDINLLSANEIVTISNYILSKKDIHKYNNIYKQAVIKDLFSKPFTDSDLKKIINNSTHPIITNLALEEAIFSVNQKDMARFIKSKLFEFDVNSITKAINVISLLNRKKINLGQAINKEGILKQMGRFLSFKKQEHNCSQLKIKKVDQITSDNLGNVIFCSNKAYKKGRFVKGTHVLPITKWYSLPLNLKIKKIIANNLKIKK